MIDEKLRPYLMGVDSAAQPHQFFLGFPEISLDGLRGGVRLRRYMTKMILINQPSHHTTSWGTSPEGLLTLELTWGLQWTMQKLMI